MQFVGLDAATANNGDFQDTAGSTATTANPGGNLDANFSRVTGDTDVNSVDASMTFRFFVPRDFAGGGNVVPLANGNFQQLSNDADSTGSWLATDPRDRPASPATGQVETASAPRVTITAKSVATQKGVTVVGGGPVTQDSGLEYTIDFEVSDYFAFDQFNLPDFLPDGVRFSTGFAPQLEMLQQSGDSPLAAINATNYTAGGVNADGTQTVTFFVSNELIYREQTCQLLGGGIPIGGTGGATPPVDAAGNPPSSPLKNLLTGMVL